MPNSIIVAGMDIIIGSAHLHCRHPKEVEDEVVIDGTTEGDVGGEEEDAVENSRVSKEYQRTLL